MAGLRARAPIFRLPSLLAPPLRLARPPSRALTTDAAGRRADSGDHMPEGFGLPASGRSLTLPGPFRLEYGGSLPSLTLGYHTYGTLARDGRNAVLVGHSLTSNSAVHEWWGALIGPGPAFALDTTRFFVVCANYLGSVYGSSGPLSRGPSGAPYAADFPVATLKDNAAAQRALLAALGVRSVALAIGGSLGGMLALEVAAAAGAEGVRALCVVGSCGRHPDWAIGLGEAGRQAIYADPAWAGGYYARQGSAPPLAGMSVARQLAMLSYRTPQSLAAKFGRKEVAGGRSAALRAAQGLGPPAQGASASAPCPGAPPPLYEVEGYLNYQGAKFQRRFDPLAYVRLTQLLDSHDLGRGRGAGGDYRAALAALRQRALVVGIDSDLLYPFELSKEMAELIPGAELHAISSPHGHDSFLIEIQALNATLVAWRDRVLPAEEEGEGGEQPSGGEAALLAHAQWQTGSGSLRKRFVFRDAQALRTFGMRAADVLLAAGRGGSPLTAAPPDSGAAECVVELARGEVALAMRLDEVAAELQLGGRWN